MPFSFFGSNANSSLERLRRVPLDAMQRNAFHVEDEAYQGRATGGPCSLRCADLGNDVVGLTVEGGGRDYFFPWVPKGRGGVGDCLVPTGAPEGTVVLTGGMNGCAFQVNREDGGLRFYHDADSNSLGPVPGTQRCRVGYFDYATRLELGRQAMLEAQPRGSGGFYYAYYLMAIKLGTRWQVYASGVLANGGEYTKIRAGITPLMTSFDDA